MKKLFLLAMLALICAYAGRRDGRAYKHSHEEIWARYGADICMAERGR